MVRLRSEFNIQNVNNLGEKVERGLEKKKREKNCKTILSRSTRSSFVTVHESIGHLRSCPAPITWKPYWEMCRYVCEICFPKIDVKSIGSSQYVNNELSACAVRRWDIYMYTQIINLFLIIVAILAYDDIYLRSGNNMRDCWNFFSLEIH